MVLSMSSVQYKGRIALLAACFLGVLFSYLVNGIVVEKISRGNAFNYYTSIVMVTTIFNTFVAKLFLVLKYQENKDEGLNNHASLKTTSMLILCSSCYVMAMMSANAALKYVNYPTQIVGKSAKPVVVLIMNFILVQKRYSSHKCASIVLVVTGVTTFMLENVKGRGSNIQENDSFGTALVALSLLFDGFVAAIQEKLRDKCSFSAHGLMYEINKWASILMFTIAGLRGELVPFLHYSMKTDKFCLYIFALCFTGVLGQQFIFLTVVNFGPLACSVITTTRKFFTILLSTIIFHHVLTFKHWFCVTVVFFGLALDVFL